MKVLLINGSPNAHGCTYTALSEVAKTLEENGISTEIVHVGHLNIRGCISCGKCTPDGHCVFDDIVNEVGDKMRAADGLVVGSPVYYASSNATLNALLDRMFFSNRTDLTMKVGACVVSARRGGCSSTFDQLNKYFTISGMPIASSQYWPMVHGNTPEEVEQDEEGLQIMRTLARNLAWMMKSFAIAKEHGILPPAPEKDKKRTNFIR